MNGTRSEVKYCVKISWKFTVEWGKKLDMESVGYAGDEYGYLFKNMSELA